VAHSQSALSYPKAVKRVAAEIQDRLYPGDTAAFVDFEGSSGGFPETFINDVTGELLKSGLRMVERRNIEQVLAEQDFQLSGYVSDDSLVSIGNMLGAGYVIMGKGENRADYYRLTIKMLSVETAEILMLSSVNLRYDNATRRLLDDTPGGSRGIGATHFGVGARLGAGFQMNTADEDMVGSGFTPKEKSNIAFAAALFGAFKFNDAWAIQPELGITLNNGMEISGQGRVVTIAYPTLDIPLLVRWNFIQRPVLAGFTLGPYVSLPLGKLNLSVDDKGSALDMTGLVFGVSAGLVAGVKAGPGYITGDLRFVHDFSSLKVQEDFSEGVEEANICLRRSISLTLGYEFSL
jgi:hypothetical protein